MKLKELMGNYKPETDYEGFATNDDYVLAIDAGESTSENDFEVVELGVSGVGFPDEPDYTG